MGIVATDRDTDLVAAIRELAEYLGEDPVVTALNAGNSFYLEAEAWERARPSTPAEILQYYRTTSHQLGNLVVANYGVEHQRKVRQRARDCCVALGQDVLKGYVSVLDVGAGIGSTLLAILKSGAYVDCVHADVGGVLMQYAKWRYAKRRAPVTLATLGDQYLDEDPLGTRQFELVVCTEVLEHAPDPERLTEYLARHTAPGGLLVCEVSFDDDHGLMPYHLNRDRYDNESFLREVLPRCGFRPAGEWTYVRI